MAGRLRHSGGWLGAVLVCMALTGPVVGQVADNNGALVASSVLTIDPERLFSQSLYGQKLVAQVQADTETLAAENRQIEADLTAEETDLAKRRPTMAADAFRAEAEAFDVKVQDIRRAQDAKERALQDQITAGRENFFLASRPVLGQLMLSRGAVVIIDRRSAFLSIGAIDITEEALAAINDTFGEVIPDPTTAPEDTGSGN